MKLLAILGCLSSVVWSAFAGSADSVLHFAGVGFDIQPLAASPEGGAIVALFLPAHAGFAPNVNVVVQPFTGELAQYVEISKGEFKANGARVLQESNPSPAEWKVEYEGTMKNAALHWYARALLTKGKVYLVTATSSAALWQDTSSQLRQCVDSFALTSSP